MVGSVRHVRSRKLYTGQKAHKSSVFSYNDLVFYKNSQKYGLQNSTGEKVLLQDKTKVSIISPFT
jgi:hypothetical protein